MSKIHSLIPLIMSEVGAIAKGRRNKQQDYSFRGIDDAYHAFQPLFAKHGVFVVPFVLESAREERQTKSGGTLIYTTLKVRHTFYASDASSFDCVTVGEAMDSGDKSSNKAMSSAMKYALLEVFCVPTEGDNDTENHSPEVKPATVTQVAPTPAPAKPAKSDFTPQQYRDAWFSKLTALTKTNLCTEAELVEFAIETGIINENQSLGDWPDNKIPHTKKDADALLEEIKHSAQGIIP